MSSAVNFQIQGRRSKEDNARDVVLKDVDVVQWVIEGEVDAFEIIIRRYNQRLFRIARGILKNDADAEDAVQESYINAYLNLRQYSQKASFSGWLSRIVVNQALSRKRSAERKNTYTESICLDGALIDKREAVDDILPDRLANSNVIRQLIEQAIDSLPLDFRIVFVMRVVEQLSVRETAQALLIEEATVRSRQYRAVRRLREALNKVYEEQVTQSFGFAGFRCDRIVNAVLSQIRKK